VQVANDFLGLRQPVHVTSLAYLSLSPMAEQHHLAVGTQFGDVRRYDTRAARRPVASWKGVGKMEGVKIIKKGLEEQ
jgi:ribosome biogenesis protein NSA1